MIIIGDKLVPYEKIFRIYHQEQIAETQANSTILFKYNSSMLTYASQNNLPYAVVVTSIKEALYSNALTAKYIICQKDIAKGIQKIADNYMFDSKILAIIESNEEFETVVLDEIDGVIFQHILN